jgi:hypothetical protein
VVDVGATTFDITWILWDGGVNVFDNLGLDYGSDLPDSKTAAWSDKDTGENAYACLRAVRQYGDDTKDEGKDEVPFKTIGPDRADHYREETEAYQDRLKKDLAEKNGETSSRWNYNDVLEVVLCGGATKSDAFNLIASTVFPGLRSLIIEASIRA